MEKPANNDLKKTKGAIVGTVISDKADKTRVIEVKNRETHPKYKKTYTTTSKFMAHDPENKTKVGDKVTIVPSRPLSKTKKFIIV